MKQIFVLVIAGILTLHLRAQEATSVEDDSEETEIVIVREWDRYDDKILIELTNDFWLNMPKGVEHRGLSPGFKAYFFSDYTFGQDAIVSFAWGFGISADNVHSNAVLQQEVAPNGDLGDQVLTPLPKNSDFEKNKFATTYLEIPLELRLIPYGRRPFKFAAGFRVGYLLQDKQKIIDAAGKRKIYDFEYITKWRYGLSARVGVGKVQLTGFYSLVPLIEEGKGTEIIPFSVGLAFTPIR